MGDLLSVSFSPLMFESPLNETSNVVTQSGEPSENSEPTSQSHELYCCHTGRPLIFESQDSESSNLDTNSQEPSENSETTQSEDPDKCIQIFSTETQFDLVCPEDADESNENPDESTENADVSGDTVILETSDYTENTETLSQYVSGSDTQDIRQEIFPAT